MPDWHDLVRSHLPPLGLRAEREAEIVDEMARLLEDFHAEAGASLKSEADVAAWIRAQVPEWSALSTEIRDTERPLPERLLDPLPAESPHDDSLRRFTGDLMERVLKDGRYALRMLAKDPGFTALAVITLAIGIGLNSAVFSIVNALLLKPLPVAEPQRLASIYTLDPSDYPSHLPMSFPDFEDLRRRTESYSQLIAFAMAPLVVEHDDQSRLVFSELATGNYFSALGIQPVLGRTFTEEDDRPGDGNAVAVLSHRTWQRRFGAADVLGKTLRLNGQPFTVIGVAAPAFLGLTRIVTPELWVPMQMSVPLRAGAAIVTGSATPGVDRLHDRGLRWHYTLGRLRPDVTFDQAAAEVEALGNRLRTAYPDSNKDLSLTLVPTSQVRLLPGLDAVIYSTSWVLLGLAALVLLIASANIANMLLARAVERRREIATRIALGASRGAVVRQLLIESLMLAIAGGGLGLLLALIVARTIRSVSLPLPLELTLDLSLDYRVVLFTFSVSTLTALAFGLAPAFESLRTDLSAALVGGSRGSSGSRGKRRLRSALVVAQVALSLLLLICAGLSVRSMMNAHRIDPGFDPSGVVVARLAPDRQGYGPEQTEAFYRQLEDRVSALPGVRSVGYASHVPLSFEINGETIAAEGQESLPVEKWSPADDATVGPGYFETMGIPLIRGRVFTDQDDRSVPGVVLVNETLAARMWPGSEAIGKRLLTEDDEEPFEVVGVVADGKYRTLGEAPRSYVYFALAQTEPGSRMLLVRVEGDPATALGAIRREVRRLDERIAVSGLETLEKKISRALLVPRLSAVLFGFFGAVGLLLASVGIYGVIAYNVSRRTREIGIRMAMGARSSSILGLVVREGFILTIAGIVLGVAAAAAVTRVLSAVLYGISATDVVTFALVPLFFVLVALVASGLPASRASRTNPVETLRWE